MKCHLRFGIVVWMICGAFLFAQTNPSSSERKQESPTINSNTQEPMQTGVGKVAGKVGGSSDAKDTGLLDGMWEGDMVFLPGVTPYQKVPATSRFRVTIQGSAVRVYNVHPQDVKEVKPTAFHIERLMTNAVIYATDSGYDNEGTWVETWVFAVTWKNRTTLLANFSRMVNNLDLPLASDHSKFTHAAAGELNLIETPATTDQKQEHPPSVTPQQAFGGGTASAGSLIEQAARAAANRGGYGGDSGDYGLGIGAKPTTTMGPLEILTDTKGVDLRPYLQKVIRKVQTTWYNVIPYQARAPIMKKGKVTIEFAILKSGEVAGMKLVSTSGDVALDRGAWSGIAESSPFPAFPSEFDGQYLAVRFAFYYNPAKGDVEAGKAQQSKK